MLDENDSCSVRSTGFTLSHLLPRMSTTTVKPRARTSSLTDTQTERQTDRPWVNAAQEAKSSTFRGVILYAATIKQIERVLPGYGRQVSDQSAEVFLFYSIMIGPGREGQDWSTTLVASTWKTQVIKLGHIKTKLDRTVGKSAAMCVLPDTKATFSLSTVRTSTARTHSALPEPERQIRDLFSW